MNNVREGKINEDGQEFARRFLANKTLNPCDFGVDFAPEMFCTNDDVDYTNHVYLEGLAGDLKLFKSTAVQDQRRYLTGELYII